MDLNTSFAIHAWVSGCFLAAVAICLCARRICHHLLLMDMPVGRKQHAAPTPLMGGVVVLAVLIPAVSGLILFELSERWQLTATLWLLCVAAMALIGIADDRHSLSPRARLAISFFLFGSVAVIDPTFNIRVLDFSCPRWTLGLGTWWLAMIFTVICCVGLINAVNMADGKNGLVISLSLGWLIILALRAPPPILPIILLLGAVLVALLLFNIRGSLFLGDGGAYAVATAVGLLAIIIYNTPGRQTLRSIFADELVVLFAVPVIDSFRLTYVRLKQGRSPMDGDRDHFHHHLQSYFGWPIGLLVYLLVALTPITVLQIFA